MRANWIFAVVLLAGTAHASQNFPKHFEVTDVVEARVTLPAEPTSCLLCHKDEEGGADTATKPFAQTMVGLGLKGQSRASLDAALRKLLDDEPDSDRDGLDDLAELQAGRDPNVPEVETADGGIVVSDAPLPNAIPPFETGCSIARRHREGLPAFLLLVAALLLRRHRLTSTSVRTAEQASAATPPATANTSAPPREA